MSRIGIFDDSNDKTVDTGSNNSNGHFFQLQGNTISIVERSYGVDNVVPQNLWNIDKFDSTGPSGIILSSYTNTLFFAIEQEWLGVGTVNFGFIIDRKLWFCHKLTHTIMSQGTNHVIPYTKTCKLPIRYEINAIGTPTAPSEMRMMCSTVISEGGFEPTSRRLSFARTANPVTIPANTEIPILSIRLASMGNRITIKPISIHVINVGTGLAKYYVRLNSTLTGASFTNVDSTYSNVQQDSSANTISGGVILYSDFAPTKITKDFIIDISNGSIIICSNIAGISDILTISAVRLANAPQMTASIDWIEII